MASVYRIIKEQRKSGMRYIVDYRDDSGRRTMRRFKKARDAEAFKKQVEASTYNGIAIPRPVSMTFADWTAEWFAQKEAFSKVGKKPRPSTLDSWRSDLKSLLAFFGNYKLHTVTTDSIVRYVEHLQTTPIRTGIRNRGQIPSDKSIRNKVGVLSQILRSAKARNIIPTNPAQHLDWKELLGTEEKYHKRHRDIPLTPEQLIQLLDTARKKYTPKGWHEPTGPYYPLFEVAVWTGLRKGELIGLRWGDVDLTSSPAVLSVQRSSYKGVDGPTKSMAGVREVLLIDRVVQALGRHRELCFGATLPQNWQGRATFPYGEGHET